MTSHDLSALHTDRLSLGDVLKSGTRDWHARAERSGVMAALLSRTIQPPAYVALLFNLLQLYEALERALVSLPSKLGRTDDWIPAPRSPPLRSDLQSLQSLGWTAPAAAEPAMVVYTARLLALSSDAPHRLIGHAYARSLGDLHGGQILLRLIRECAHLPPGCTTRFYEFGDAKSVADLRTRFRSHMRGLPLSALEVADVLDEACWSFAQHCQLFEQIQAHHA